MTTETSVIVGLPATDANRRLVRDVQSAALRALKADPGDRGDAVRFETLSVQLELAAEAYAISSGDWEQIDTPDCVEASGPSFEVHDLDVAFGDSIVARLNRPQSDHVRRWLDDGRIVVWVCQPHGAGATRRSSAKVEVPPPAERWESEDGAGGKQAVIQRFRSQLVAATGEGECGCGAINPSGINNQVITEVLRDFVGGAADSCTRVAVEYRDGSQASNPFPLKCVPLANAIEGSSDIDLRIALLSIRHAEMDAVVDGAWLRNAEVSKPRPAALTDDFVFATSQTQLAELTKDGTRSVTMRLFQTGLDAAIVGFYRAVVEHLMAHPGSLTVIPMFFSSQPVDDNTVHEYAGFIEGLPWVTRPEVR